MRGAGQLLQRRNYPQTMMERFRALEARIEDGKGEEGKIIIRFNPVTKRIFAEATLNRRIRQKFLIDTGASKVSIPSSAIDALGIEINEETPMVAVSTVGGVGWTYEVVLDSIELMGFRVYNVNVVIIDIPSAPELGLLGQNFLENFQMEIDNKKGILKLKPRD